MLGATKRDTDHTSLSPASESKRRRLEELAGNIIEINCNISGTRIKVNQAHIVMDSESVQPDFQMLESISLRNTQNSDDTFEQIQNSDNIFKKISHSDLKATAREEKALFNHLEDMGVKDSKISLLHSKRQFHFVLAKETINPNIYEKDDALIDSHLLELESYPSTPSKTVSPVLYLDQNYENVAAASEPAVVLMGIANTADAPATEKKRKKAPNFTDEEDQAILQGYHKYPENWEEILKTEKFNMARTTSSLRSRWQRLRHKDNNARTVSPPPKPDFLPTIISAATSQLSFSMPSTPMLGKSLSAVKKIDDYFRPKSLAQIENSILQASSSSANVTNIDESAAESEVLVNDHDSCVKIITDLRGRLACQTTLYNDRISEYFKEKGANESRVVELQDEIENWRKKYYLSERANIDRAKKTAEIVVNVMRAECRQKARLVRCKNAEESLRLAKVSMEKRGLEYIECWQEGYVFQDIQDSLNSVYEKRDEVEKRKRSLAKVARQIKKTDTAECSNLQIILADDNEPSVVEEEEVIKYQLLSLKRSETDFLQKLEKMNADRDMHIKACRIIRQEDDSRFNNNPILNERYLLLNLIGKGGMSEVYRAFDLINLEFVACKIHSLNEQWNQDKKRNYMKHSLREYQIHKSLQHAHIVKLDNVFEHDQFSFCTILEYIDGSDLETHLQICKTMPEKEAKSIITQILCALVYMNKLEHPIIHYDLKPGVLRNNSGNILLHNGIVKIIDFGLSKIVNDSNVSTPITKRTFAETDLTSQGAGTYWYLPPEVFEKTETIKISSKVDVWSLGVIFFEMVFGAKPFGNDKSQFSVLSEGTISIDGHALVFPAKPLVSGDCKDFIRRCLTYHKEKRPDILMLANDFYFKSAAKPCK